jgi:hypothetical protein
VVDDGVPPDAVELVDGRVQRHGADHVGRAGLLAVGRVGPGHLVEVDQVDGAATGEEGVAVRERRPWAHQHAGAERGVHLVAAPGQEVGVRREGAVGGELGGVDKHRHAAFVGRGNDVVDRRQPAGDVGGAGHGQQPGARSDVEGGDVPALKVPSGPHSTNRRRHSRAQGNRLAWCSTTVVTTMSSAASRSR